MTLPRKAHAVIFDVDGSIFDTEPLYRGAMISAARESGHDMNLEVYHSIIGLSVEALKDSYHGVRAASNAGMTTIMVPDLLAAIAEMEKLCVCIVQNLHQVCTLM
jgi:beta-phosphoglucomutase-like phosphatase (HAD superfamily)